MGKKQYLSASRIKTLETCSWLYWGKYHLNLPDKTNDGAIRGSICHLIFELLLNKKHKKHFTVITKKNDMEASPAIVRLVNKQLQNHKAASEENYELIKTMILVGLKFDFYCKGSKLGKPEKRFDITNEDPPYRIMGFIDKFAEYGKDKVKIVDYKSSKAKFRGDELSANVQGMMYSLAAKTLWPEIERRIINFMFLRFPRQPIQELEFSDEQLKGFEHYLSTVYKLVNDFREEHAKANYAKDNYKNSWLCGRGKWVCPHKNPYKYYVLLDKKQRVVQTSYSEEFKNIKEGYSVEQREYKGCPRFYSAANTQKDDPFDF